MTIVRVGATQKYSLGWEAAFGKGKASHAKPAGSGKHPAAKTSAAKAVSAKIKAAGKKKSKKKK